MSNDPTRPDPREHELAASTVASGLPSGSVLGKYTLLDKIGDGGMGVVYRAQQRAPIRRLVALKVIRPGFDSAEVIARFESERQTLAQMDHANIARVLDAGTTVAGDALPPGRPYFAMEFVPGLPITRFADEQRLSVAERLELFGQTCAAIAHAHTKGIIHRDIKPGNVLASMQDGKPLVKVIDFGIAKALSGERMSEATYATGLGQAIGTLEYMSPEQAAGSADIDTRTDVYALGALLYELLSGDLPFDRRSLSAAALDEAIRLIRETEPPRPSTRISDLMQGKGADAAEAVATRRRLKPDSLLKQLRAELEWIPLKALRRERARRYESVAQMAEDVRAYLEGRPLRAGPESRVYVARKFVRRNRLAVGAAAALAVALMAGFVGTAYGLRRAEQQRLVAVVQRDEADRQRRDADQQKAEAERQKGEAERERAEAQTQAQIAGEVGAFLTGMFNGATPEETQGKDVTAVELVLRAAGELDGRLRDRPTVKAALQHALGTALGSLGHAVEGEQLLKRALEARLTTLGADHPDTLRSAAGHALALHLTGHDADAEPLYADVLQRRRRLLGSDDPETIASINDYAAVLDAVGRSKEAEPMFKDALERRRRVLGDDHLDTIASVNSYGHVLLSVGRAAEAEPYYLDALTRRRRVLGADHPDALASANDYANLLRERGRAAEAEPVMSDSLERSRRVFGPDHPNTLKTASNYASVLMSLGRLPESAALHGDVLARRRRVLGDDHPSTLISLNNYAHALLIQDRPADAEPLYAEAVERRRRVLGPDHPATITSVGNYAAVLRQLGRTAEAGPLYEQVLASRRRTNGDAHPNTLAAMDNYAFFLSSVGRLAEAEPLHRDALAGYRQVMGDDHPETLKAAINYGSLLLALDRPAEAEPLFADALARSRRVLGEAHPTTVGAYEMYADALARGHRGADAEALLRGPLDAAARSAGPSSKSALQLEFAYAKALAASGRHAEAALLADAVVRRVDAASAGRHPRLGEFSAFLAGEYDATGRGADATALRARYAGRLPSRKFAPATTMSSATTTSTTNAVDPVPAALTGPAPDDQIANLVRRLIAPDPPQTRPTTGATNGPTQ